MSDLKNYRVTFGGINIDYKSNFKKCREYMYYVQRIMQKLELYGVPANQRWFFFEPYVEITWVSDMHPGKAEVLMEDIRQFLTIFSAMADVKFMTPDNGEFADWYFAPGNLTERQFGYERYALCASQAELFYKYLAEIDGKNAKGLDNHYVRSCHVLANQLGLSYKEEGRLLFWRGILCKLFWWFGHHKAVWIYTKIFRQKY